MFTMLPRRLLFVLAFSFFQMSDGAFVEHFAVNSEVVAGEFDAADASSEEAVSEDESEEQAAVKNAEERRMVALMRGGQVLRIDERSFNAMMFGDQFRGSRRESLESVLDAQVKKTCDVYHLSQLHQRKLQLAGRADISRLFEQIDQIKSKVCRGPIPIDEFRDVRPRIDEQRHLYRNYPFRSEDSLYLKVFHRIVESEKVVLQPLQFIDDAAAVDAVRDVEYYKYLTKIVADLLLEHAPLRDNKQLIQVAEMLRQQLQREAHLSLKDPAILRNRLSQIPDGAWQSVLNQAQWMRLRQEFAKQ